MSEISFDIEDYDLLEAFQEVEGSSSSAPQGIELKELTGDEAPSDEEPSDSEPEEQSKKVKTTDASLDSATRSSGFGSVYECCYAPRPMAWPGRPRCE